MLDTKKYHQTVVHWLPLACYAFVLVDVVLERQHMSVLTFVGFLLLCWSFGKGYGASFGVLRIDADERLLKVQFGLKSPDNIELSAVQSVTVVKKPKEYGWFGTSRAARYPAFRLDAVEVVVKAEGQNDVAYRIPTKQTQALYEFINNGAGIQPTGCER